MMFQNFKNNSVRSAILCCGFVLTAQVHAEQSVTVYAAASLTNAMTDLDHLFEKQNKLAVKTSYAGSSTLAKQIEAGAPADVFISADEQWMNYLQNKKLIQSNKRVNLLGNRLVLISPKSKPIKIKMDKSFDPSTAFQGKICTGDTKSVPVGKYGKQALTSLGWWQKLAPRLVETEDVRAALNFVARGECQLGIVYATDAAISKDVTVVGVFPISTHTPIVYPLGLVQNNPQSVAFYQFLQGKQANAVFKKYGFTVLLPAQ
ncbi:molybdate ABC transporter substrate-binding protein [Acinetobacter rongchengensis]|uniref:Molybdate ABC transporter substrate-binding protein n=1 Tax=Acinetobacter rongchengensis TaxID=2419601 RepID=A0A3A8F3A3_9GAMM|nr:molybdate ABC transporter substrate-binding protein [Acinetobacter rongchengensis]RKG37540.1 molybdate ABC transporter substrate-binding protein [Acinetobacter rongchengensis]